MLSPWADYKSVPKKLLANLDFRVKLLEAAEKDRSLQKGLIEICKRDILFYINTFVWQYDPTQKGSRVGPFITWPFQDRALTDTPETTGRHGLLWCVENKVPCVWEKAREMGATWLMLIAQDWLCLFQEHFQALDISKSADAVDSNSKNSLFAKVRFMHECLPDWMKGELVENKMYIAYPRMRSEMTGEASSKRSGVGGRGGFVGVDEAAEIEELGELRGKLASTAPFRLFVSTHLGEGNPFYSITTDSAYVKRQMHWIEHPEKNKGLYSCEGGKIRFWEYLDAKDEVVELVGPKDSCLTDYEFDMSGLPAGGPYPGIRSPWYDKKSAEIGDATSVATQLDIDPKGSVQQFYPVMLIKELKRKALPPFWEGDIEYNKETGVPKHFVKAGEMMEGGRVAGNKIKMWLHLRDGKVPVGKYGGGGDVSQGTGASDSALSIANGRGEKVLEYVDNSIDPLSFAVLCVAICSLFVDEYGEPAKLTWEHVGPGTAFGKKVVKDLGYRNFYRHVYKTDLREKESESPGFNPGVHGAKLKMHVEYVGALRTGKYKNWSESALDECLRFKHDGKGGVEHSKYMNALSPSGSALAHGDIVVADALSFMVIQPWLVGETEVQKTLVLDVRTLAGRRLERERAEKAEVWD